MAGPRSLSATTIKMEAAALDLRRQRQIANQTDVINRLLANNGVKPEDYKVSVANLLGEQSDKIAVLEAQALRIREVVSQPVDDHHAAILGRVIRILDGEMDA